MVCDFVRRNVLIDFAVTEATARPAAGAADARLCIDDDLVANDASRNGRGQREDGGRGVAARVRDERCGGDRIAVEFGEPVHRGRQQVGRGVRLAEPLLKRAWLLEPKVGGDIDNFDTSS